MMATTHESDYSLYQPHPSSFVLVNYTKYLYNLLTLLMFKECNLISHFSEGSYGYPDDYQEPSLMRQFRYVPPILHSAPSTFKKRNSNCDNIYA